MKNTADQLEGADLGGWLISPLVGEMGGSPERGAVPPTSQLLPAAGGGLRSTLPPSALPSFGRGAGISPARGEIGSSPAFAIFTEQPADRAARDALLDRAMSPRWRKKSSEKLRRGRKPSLGLALIARDMSGQVVGTVRLWDVAAGEGGPIGQAKPALLLGPLAVDPALKSAGIGGALMRVAIEEAKRFGHKAILLVGDAPYYARFGFSAEKTGKLAMPGPYERHRFLALELVEGALDGAAGVLRPTGRLEPRHLAA